MRGVALSGPTGAGKTTVQRRLVSDHGVWTPRNYTTRVVADDEHDVVGISEDTFRNSVHAGQILLPQYFGGTWYGWSSEDMDRLHEPEGRAVLNVRPYTALILGGLIREILPVWLYVSPEELDRRRVQRSQPRDTGDHMLKRTTDDDADKLYVDMFRHRVISDSSAIDTILALLEIR